MLDPAVVLLGGRMLAWSHARLLGELLSRGYLAAPAPAAEPELTARKTDGGWRVDLASIPPLRPGAEAVQELLERRAGLLRALTIATLSSPHRPTLLEVVTRSDTGTGQAEAVLRGRTVRLVDSPQWRTSAGPMASFEELIDFDGPVETDAEDPLDLEFAAFREPLGLGEPSLTEWPNNVLSLHLRVRSGGLFDRTGGKVARYLQAELRRQRLVAEELADLVADAPLGMGTEVDHGPLPFLSMAPPEGRPAPDVVDEGWIRSWFDGAIAPFVQVRTRPFTPDSELLAAIGPHAAAWGHLAESMVRWGQLRSPTFVEIGLGPSDRPLPEGVASHGSILPRLAIGFSPRGCVVGVSTQVTWT